ncbi:hypothetical protein [Streptomyces xinghaiensis]|uniref:hypothetical protein n=1 Tax=Streptomyces xinghaiensis TaxID=1038928 RepID=UPI00344170A9
MQPPPVTGTRDERPRRRPRRTPGRIPWRRPRRAPRGAAADGAAPGAARPGTAVSASAGAGWAARAVPYGPAAVAVLFTLAQLALVVPGTGLGWDETVYVSQVSSHAPAAFFSAPRARGITYLAAPVAALTDAVPPLRVWLALLSGAGLFLALRVWRGLLPAAVLTLAGGLFAGLWVTLFYGPLVMPNLWVALAALFTTGCLLRAVRDPASRLAPAGVCAGVAVVALMRPSDALWLALPLGAALLLVRSWRRPLLLAALVAGGALGSAEWIAEAYSAYGGPAARLRRASEIQGHLAPYFSVDDHIRALGGRTLCRPCDVPWRNPGTGVWWFALPLLAGGGALAARRTRHRAEILLPALTGLVLALPYLFLVGYAAPRFLLPAYALLSLPVAHGLFRLARWVREARPGLRPAAAALSVTVLGLHLGVQFTVLHSTVSSFRVNGERLDRMAAELGRQGVRPPCVVSGPEAVRIAFRAGCSSRQVGGHDGSITHAALRATAETRPVAVLVTNGADPPPYARAWRSRPLPDFGPWRFRAYLSPAARPDTGPVTARD